MVYICNNAFYFVGQTYFYSCDSSCPITDSENGLSKIRTLQCIYNVLTSWWSMEWTPVSLLLWKQDWVEPELFFYKLNSASQVIGSNLGSEYLLQMQMPRLQRNSKMKIILHVSHANKIDLDICNRCTKNTSMFVAFRMFVAFHIFNLFYF